LCLNFELLRNPKDGSAPIYGIEAGVKPAEKEKATAAAKPKKRKQAKEDA
jgi:hypothetical protein